MKFFGSTTVSLIFKRNTNLKLVVGGECQSQARTEILFFAQDGMKINKHHTSKKCKK